MLAAVTHSININIHSFSFSRITRPTIKTTVFKKTASVKIQHCSSILQISKRQQRSALLRIIIYRCSIMAKINLVFFLLAIFVATSASLPTSKPRVEISCEEGPKVYCKSTRAMSHCNIAAEECEKYKALSPCKKEPEDYCATPEIAASCGPMIKAFCMGWPDSHVNVVPINTSIWRTHTSNQNQNVDMAPAMGGGF